MALVYSATDGQLRSSVEQSSVDLGDARSHCWTLSERGMNAKEMTLARERLPQRSIVTRFPMEKVDYRRSARREDEARSFWNIFDSEQEDVRSDFRDDIAFSTQR